MGIFSTSSPLDPLVEKATSENNTTDDWGKIMEVCDKINEIDNGQTDGIKSLKQRLKNDNPRVVLQTITLIDACVNNCGRSFHLKVAERDFEQELYKMITGRNTHAKVATKLREVLKKWAEGDFKHDPELGLIPALYRKMLVEGHAFNSPVDTPTQPTFSDNPDVVNTQQEEDDIARAIELSLKESGGDSRKYGSKEPTSLYSPASAVLTEYSSTQVPDKEPQKVRALYDFEAAEDNELTFKAGEIVFVIDNSDANWWKGSNHRGEGLFPSNFVTEDLEAEEHKDEYSPGKKVSFSESVQVTEVPDNASEITGEVDVDKIDQLLHVLHDADPTGESADDASLPTLEDQVNAMAPTIDAELEQIDRRHAQLARLSTDLGEALELYQQLMREMPAAQPYYNPYSQHMRPPQMNQPYNPASDMPPSYMSLAMQGMPQMYSMPNQQPPPYMTHPGAAEPYVPIPSSENQTIPQGLPQSNGPESMPMSPPAGPASSVGGMNYSYPMYAPPPDQAIYTQAPHVPQQPISHQMPSHVQHMPQVAMGHQEIPQGHPMQGYPQMPPHGGAPVPFYQTMQQPLL